MDVNPTVTQCADCDKEAAVGWSHSPDYPPPVWLCHEHFQTRLEQAADPFELRAAP